MVFANPLYLLLLLCLIPAIIWYILKHKKAQAALQVSSTQAFAKLPKTYKYYLRHFLFILRLGAIACIIIVLARPQATDRWENQTREGITVYKWTYG